MPNTLLSFALTPYFGLPSGDELAREWRAMHGPSPKRVKWEPDGITCEADGVRTIIVAARHPIPGGRIGHHDDVKQGFEQLMDVATYVAELGRDLQPGETVGAEGTAQRIAVARAPLPTDKRGRVCRFEAIDPSAK